MNKPLYSIRKLILLFAAALVSGLCGCETFPVGGVGNLSDRGIHAVRDVDAQRGTGTKAVVNMNYNDALFATLQALMANTNHALSDVPDVDKGIVRAYFRAQGNVGQSWQPVVGEGWIGVFLTQFSGNQTAVEVIELMTTYNYPKMRQFAFEKEILDRIQAGSSQRDLTPPRFWDGAGGAQLSTGWALDKWTWVLLRLGEIDQAAESFISASEELDKVGQLPALVRDAQKFQAVPKETWLEMLAKVEDKGGFSIKANTLAAIGWAYKNLDQLEKAESALRKAIKTEQKFADAHQILSTVLGSQGKYEEAAAESASAWQYLQGDDERQGRFKADLYFYLGISLADLGWFEAGLEALRAAIKHNTPNAGEANAYIAFLEGKGAHHGATRYRFHPAEEKGEILTVVRRSPAWTAGVRPGDRWSGLKHDGRENQLFYVPLLTGWKIGNVAPMKVERGGETFTFYLPLDWAAVRQKASELNQEGLVAAKKGDLDGAFEKFRSAAEVDPAFAQPRFNLALIYEKRQAYRESALEYLAYIAFDAQASDLQAVRIKVRDLAEKTNTKLYDLFPREARDLLREGNKQAESQNYAGAIFSYLKAVERCPGFPEPHRNLGAMFEALELNQSAVKQFEQYLAMGFADAEDINRVEQHLTQIHPRLSA